MKYRKDITGLRGLAVFLVLIYHYSNNTLKAGYIGVDVFFLISGYVMMLVYKKRITSKLTVTFFFYLNRIKKIIPLSYVVLLYIAAKVHNFKDYNPDVIQIDIRYAIFGISNIRFYNINIDYMYKSQPPSPILHFWSLSIEEQFYLLFPLLLFSKAFTIYILFIISLTYSIIVSNKLDNLAYFIFKVRLWEFLFGILLFNNQRYIKRGLNCFSIIGILFLLTFSFYFNNNSTFPSYYPIIPFTFLVPVISNINSCNYSANAILMSYLLSFIGEISYSLYLWHYVLITQYKFNNITHYITFIYFFSLFSYYLIEYPIKCGVINRYITVILSFSLGIILLRLSYNKYKYNVITKPPLFANYHTIQKECLKNAIKYTDYEYIINTKWYLLIGDSHLLGWSPFLYKLSLLKNVKLLFVWVTLANIKILTYTGIISNINSLNIYSIVSIFLSNYLNGVLSNSSNIQIRYIKCIKLLSNITRDIYFIEDIPFLLFNPHSFVNDKINNYKFHLNRRMCVYFEHNIIKSFLNDKYLIFTDIICPNTTCTLLISNILMYVDVGHLSFEFVNMKKEEILKKYRNEFNIDITHRRRNNDMFHLHYINNKIHC